MGSKHIIDSLMLRNNDGRHQRFRFRFVDLRDERDYNIVSGSGGNSAQLAQCVHQGKIRVEVRRVGLESALNRTSREYGAPSNVRRPANALLRRKNITHEIELLEEGAPSTEPPVCPFRARSIPHGHVGTFVFKYSGEGMFDKVDEDGVEFGLISKDCGASAESHPTHFLQDAYVAYGDNNGRSRQKRTSRGSSIKAPSALLSSPLTPPSDEADAENTTSTRKHDLKNSDRTILAPQTQADSGIGSNDENGENAVLENQDVLLFDELEVCKMTWPAPQLSV